jgi:hypothetical protein
MTDHQLFALCFRWAPGETMTDRYVAAGVLFVTACHDPSFIPALQRLYA